MEEASKQSKILFLFLNLDIFLRNSTPEGFAYICQNKWEGITTTQCLSIVFAVIASLDLIVTIGNLFNPLRVAQCKSLINSTKMTRPGKVSWTKYINFCILSNLILFI